VRRASFFAGNGILTRTTAALHQTIDHFAEFTFEMSGRRNALPPGMEGCMRRLSVLVVVVAAVFAVMTPAPVTGAETYDKLAYLSFNGPVQVPGVTLAAGTYRFRLTNPDTSRNVLQVLSNDGVIVYAMVNTIPDSRTSLTDEAIVTFRETPAGVPPAIRSLFYGGEHLGYEVLYPKGGPNMIAPEVPQPEITYTTTPAPEPVAAPAPEPVVEPPVTLLPPEPVAEPVGEPAPELPKTASPLPLFALGGLTSLLAGVGLGLRRRRN
jgi:LPXTG-motif cell wall-anchored protein